MYLHILMSVCMRIYIYIYIIDIYIYLYIYITRNAECDVYRIALFLLAGGQLA